MTRSPHTIDKGMVKLLLGVFFFAFFAAPIRAEGEFRSDYIVDYTVKENGTTIVTQKISLFNKLANLYAREYSIKLDTEAINNVVAYDTVGTIKPIVTTTDGVTEIRIVFNDHIIGLGEKQSFTIRFENSEIAQKIGNIWEINIPGITDSKDLNSYSVTLHVPPSFGKLAYMKPQPGDGTAWTKEQMVEGGISTAYGSEQYFQVQADYMLENSAGTDTLTEIALPPDTAFQKVYITELEPKPLNVVLDKDGNWMARYKIPTRTTIRVKSSMIIAISLIPRIDFKQVPIEISEYLKATKNWNSQFPSVRTAASEHTTPSAIYDYVTETISYDYDLVNRNPQRKGAVGALADPTHAVCMEFADTFIAIARAAGIPARQAVGYAYTTNTKLRPLSLVSDVLHAWPEYYNNQTGGWIPVDPTWASTTGGIDYFDILDFNHIVFAYNGLQDDYPYPAGSYKKGHEIEKLIHVSFVEPIDKTVYSEKFSTSILFPQHVLSGIKTRGIVTVDNPTGSAFYNISFQIISNPESLNITKTIDVLPPFSHTQVPLDYKTASLFTTGKGILEVIINDKKSLLRFTIIPAYVIILGVFLLTVFSLWLILSQLHKARKSHSI